jgi:hypothetical protein
MLLQLRLLALDSLSSKATAFLSTFHNGGQCFTQPFAFSVPHLCERPGGRDV